MANLFYFQCFWVCFVRNVEPTAHYLLDYDDFNPVTALQIRMYTWLKNVIYLSSLVTNENNVRMDVKQRITYVYTHIIGQCKPSHATHVVCVNFIRECIVTRLTDFWDFHFGRLIYSPGVFARNLLWGNFRRNIFLLFIFRFDAWLTSY